MSKSKSDAAVFGEYMTEEKKKDKIEDIKEATAAIHPDVETKMTAHPKESSEQPKFPVKFILGRKVGMGRIFDADGNVISVTFIEAGPCIVSQVKTADKEGYSAFQLSFGTRKEKLIPKPLAGHLKKAGLKGARFLREIRVNDTQGIGLGQVVKVNVFSEGDIVAVTSTSKGMGFQGAVRRHKFAGGPKTHGQSDRLRAPGSVGSSSYPSRVFKGQRMAGRMGGDTVTVKNLKVVGVDMDRNYLLIRGAVPGRSNSLVKVFGS